MSLFSLSHKFVDPLSFRGVVSQTNKVFYNYWCTISRFSTPLTSATSLNEISSSTTTTSSVPASEISRVPIRADGDCAYHLAHTVLLFARNAQPCLAGVACISAFVPLLRRELRLTYDAWSEAHPGKAEATLGPSHEFIATLTTGNREPLLILHLFSPIMLLVSV